MWDKIITWAVCSVLIYLALNFRLYMIFHHPPKRLRKRKVQGNTNGMRGATHDKGD